LATTKKNLYSGISSFMGKGIDERGEAFSNNRRWGRSKKVAKGGDFECETWGARRGERNCYFLIQSEGFLRVLHFVWN